MKPLFNLFLHLKFKSISYLFVLFIYFSTQKYLKQNKKHWATKDGCGMIGGLLFSYYSSSYFDSHVKEFRLFADIMFDTGLTLDMIAPYVPRRYLIFISIASTLCRTLCGITAGATKGSISQHFAKHNMADLNAKEGTQETLVSLVGMVFGIFIARMIQNMEKQCKILEGSSIYSYSAIVATWYIFIALTATHLWANYVGVKAVRLRSLNRQRAEVVLHDVIQKGVKLVKEDMYKVKSDTIAMKMKLVQFNEEVVIPRPSECNESLLHSVEKMIFRGKVSLGTKLSDCFNNMTRDEILSIVGHLFRNEKYLLVISPSDISESLKVNVVLRLGASEDDQLKAFIHAMILKDSMNEKVLKNKKSRTQLIARFVSKIFHESIITFFTTSKLTKTFRHSFFFQIEKLRRFIVQHQNSNYGQVG